MHTFHKYKKQPLSVDQETQSANNLITYMGMHADWGLTWREWRAVTV